jgi:23S rRNA (cytosine1962-C5)-methyltransferase
LPSDRYELIDFGNGRKLESLAGHVVDRPCPAADMLLPHNPTRWADADARFNAESKSWSHFRPWPPDHSVHCGAFRMPVRPTPFGHIGLFPEQADNWRWLAEGAVAQGQRRSALNLFGYTGAGTIALVAAGYDVAHVDAAKPNVRALRTAAELNGMPDAPIRYLVDDAAKFAAREVRRERCYHTILLDPPAYGHAMGAKAWRLERDLWPLLENCFRLLDPNSFRLLITGHSPEIDHSGVAQFIERSEILGAQHTESGLLLDSGRSQLEDGFGRRLDAGFYVRAQTPPSQL